MSTPEYSEQRPSGFDVGSHSAIHPVAWDIITPDHVAYTSKLFNIIMLS